MPRPCILIVDDDDMLRSSLARMLRGRFDVVLAENGAVALALVGKGETFDVILTDVEMPVMDGRGLVERLTEMESALTDRVLLMTGGPRDPVLLAWVEAFAIERVMTKPIESGALWAAVRVILPTRF